MKWTWVLLVVGTLGVTACGDDETSDTTVGDAPGTGDSNTSTSTSAGTSAGTSTSSGTSTSAGTTAGSTGGTGSSGGSGSTGGGLVTFCTEDGDCDGGLVCFVSMTCQMGFCVADNQEFCGGLPGFPCPDDLLCLAEPFPDAGGECVGQVELDEICMQQPTCWSCPMQ